MPKKVPVPTPRVGSQAARIAQTAANKAAFLTAYEAIGTVTGAAVQSGVNRTHVYDWLAEDDAFAKAFEASKERAVDLAEQELRRRGIAGYDKPVYQGGKRVGVIREFSDACLIFYLKGRRRDVFGDRQEVSGPQGGPIPLQAVPYDLSALSGDELRQLRALMDRTIITTTAPNGPSTP